MKKHNHRLFLLILIAISFLCFNSCRSSQEDDIVVNISKNEFDLEDQIIIGSELDKIIKKSTTEFQRLDENLYPELYSHLNSLIKQIANTAVVERREEFDWKVSVLKNDDKITAFMTPGGHLYFYSGFLKYLKAEHELVGIMAHEISYSDHDFLIEKLKTEFGNKNLSKVLSKVTGYESIAFDMANHFQDLQFSTSEVTSSDNFAMQIICEFGWDARGLPFVLDRAQNETSPVEWIAAKPIYENRIDHLMQKVGNGMIACGIPDSTYQVRYKNRIINNLP